MTSPRMCCLLIPLPAGKQFQELPFWFPDGIVFGLVNHKTRKVKMNPLPHTLVEPGDEILVIRPTVLPTGQRYTPAQSPVRRDLSEGTLHAAGPVVAV